MRPTLEGERVVTHKSPENGISQIVVIKGTSDTKVADALIDIANFPEGSHCQRIASLEENELSKATVVAVWHRETLSKENVNKMRTPSDLKVINIHEHRNNVWCSSDRYLIEGNPQYVNADHLAKLESVIHPLRHKVETIYDRIKAKIIYNTFSRNLPV